MTTESDEPLTPAGRLFLQPEMDTIIHLALGMKHPIDIDSIKAFLKNSIMINHPRFCSLLVRDRRGREYWRRTEVDIDRHVIVLDSPVTTPDSHGSTSEAAVNEYLAGLAVSTPLSAEKPLWEIHLLRDQRCAIMRIHHALGDGISLMSMFLASCKRVDDPEALPRIPSGKSKQNETRNERRRRRRNWGEVLWGILMMVWFNLVFVVDFVLRSLWVCDNKTAVTGGAGVELWPRKLATAKFLLEDMKLVKKAVPDATINDVLFGVVSLGLSRYLEHRSPNAMLEGLRLTGLAMVNLRDQQGLQDVTELMKNNSGTRWGNKFGMILLPVYYHKSGEDPLSYLKRAKSMIDRKKQSVEAHFSYKIGDLVMSLFGAKVKIYCNSKISSLLTVFFCIIFTCFMLQVACLLNYRILCNTTFSISNVVGPQDEIAYAGNPITFVRANSSSLPHALTMHMVSYVGMADMQILVAKDIIPDPEFLAKCFEEALLEMKEAAAAITTF
ncbi:O-acyltransferase WSD1-like [Tripterygium wilfordii]|uniref:O-acyltransferase WSD1-like n=1 Tax=Tripterygium wilfordii TaxID=458696 RepID=A0A7J7DGZ2_TRIWF|nr:O-acyltransferase WSD1-like [Tripterygium wilfordii]